MTKDSYDKNETLVTQQVKGELNWKDITGRVVPVAEERSFLQHRISPTRMGTPRFTRSTNIYTLLSSCSDIGQNEPRTEEKHKSGQTKARPKEFVYQGRSV